MFEMFAAYKVSQIKWPLQREGRNLFKLFSKALVLSTKNSSINTVSGYWWRKGGQEGLRWTTIRSLRFVGLRARMEQVHTQGTHSLLYPTLLTASDTNNLFPSFASFTSEKGNSWFEKKSFY